MTDQEWSACENPEAMLTWLDSKPHVSAPTPSDRKLRLFATACVRDIWPMLNDGRSKAAVEVAERYADGQADEKQLAAARAAAGDAARDGAWAAARTAARDAAWPVARYAAWAAAWDGARAAAGAAAWDGARAAARTAARDAAWVAARAAQANLLREIIPSPFHTWSRLSLGTDYDGRQILAIAQDIYESRTFHLMPILSDALEEAGCTDAAILGHLCSTGPHVRGCWALDAVLGKK